MFYFRNIYIMFFTGTILSAIFLIFKTKLWFSCLSAHWRNLTVLVFSVISSIHWDWTTGWSGLSLLPTHHIHSLGFKTWLQNYSDLLNNSDIFLSYTFLEHKLSWSNSHNLHLKIQWHNAPKICVGLNRILLLCMSFLQLSIHLK